MATLRQASHRRFAVGDHAAVGALRRLVSDQAGRLSGTPEGCARAQLVAAELAANLVLHADPGGWVLMRPLPPAGIELIAVDQGPGIADPAAAVAGRSQAPKGLGCGLAAVRRACSHFDLHSELGRGTTVLAVVDLAAPGHQPRGQPPRRCGGVSVGITEPCGDAWAVAPCGPGTAVAVVDGLGHGTGASAAADAAVEGFAAALGDPGGFLATANKAMLGTRGAAATMCLLDPDRETLRYVAAGNVNGCVLAGPARYRLITSGATLGLREATPPVPVRTCPWPPQATLVLWSDGLHSHTAAQPLGTGLLARDPAVVAATLYRDHTRGSDDATVVVIRNAERHEPRG